MSAGAAAGPEHSHPPRPLPVRRRALPWALAGLWLVVLVLALPFAGRLHGVTRDDAVDYLPAGADSTRVAELQQELPGGEALEVVLVHHREEGLTAADREAARQQAEDLARELGLAGTPQGMLSEDRTTEMHLFTVLGVTEDERQAVVPDIRDRVREGVPEGVSVRVGGSEALLADMEDVYDGVDGPLMMVTVGVVTVLLILIYRSPMLWLVPLVCVGTAAVTAMAVVYGLVQGFGLTVTTLSSSIMTVLVFGAGTDYALLLVARYREELRRHPRPSDAMTAAVRGAGPAILASSGTVAAGLLCLLAADLNSTRGLGPVGAVGVLSALAAMLTLLPALLVLLGRRVFWPRVPAHGGPEPSGRNLFDRMGSSISRRPVTILGAGAAVLGALALGTLSLPDQLRQQDNFTSPPESVTAVETVGRAFPEHSSSPLTVLTRTGQAGAVLEQARNTDGVAEAGITRDGAGWTEIAVYPAAAPETAAEADLIENLRAELRAVPGAEALVGGVSAQQLDLGATSADDLRTVIPLVLGTVLAILILLLRSVVAPLVLLAGVVASWGAALGLGGLVFGPLFGFQGTDPVLPIISFVFGVALGVDYGIFLMHRMREEVLAGADTRTAALTALRRTGGVIASAGLVLAATFTVLTTLPLVVMIQVGFVVAVGVLLDTFLVRSYIVTSTAWLLGDRIWWPGALDRRSRPAPSPRLPAASRPAAERAADDR
ncbi:MMPL family transporter [Streptomyces sp. ACA25]|uniref:MMPL family transporter n=1 Tax=Streptomyces sp. ACA25 TaxID=3022596 RepID=UPI002307A44A|nr:MMPL family transporter [Streptomyces sp. ACA25]MDB1088235.1 MMPL family transporter [Streptomyces sp. ACA25]